MAGDELIRTYLAGLRAQLPARNRQRILTEIAGHLDDAIANGLAAGLAEDDAYRQAVSRLGDPSLIAARFHRLEGGVMFASWIVAIGSVLAASYYVAFWLLRGQPDVFGPLVAAAALLYAAVVALLSRGRPLLLPSSPSGWVTLGGGLLAAGLVFWVIDSRSHSVSDTLINVIPVLGLMTALGLKGATATA